MRKLVPVILLFMLACGEEQIVSKVESPPEMLINSTLFKSLNIDHSQLDMASAIVREITGGSKSVMIPFKNRLQYVYSEGRVNEMDKLDFSEVISFQYITDFNYEQLAKSLESHTFSGELKVVSTRNFSLLLNVANNKVNGSKVLKSGKTETCSGTVGSNQWVQDVANCASQRIDNMNWWDQGWCYIALPECWAQTVISCIIDECEVIAGP